VVEFLRSDWAEEGVDGETREIPEAKGEEECVDCFKWKWRRTQESNT